MMSGFRGIWINCCNVKHNKFSTTLLDKFHFNFHFTEEFPAEKIKRALAINLSSHNDSDAWDIYTLTTNECNITAYLTTFPRDKHGRLSIGEGSIDAFYDSLNHIFRIYDFANRKAAYIYQPGHLPNEWEIHSPFREFWHLWALYNNALLIHSGVISSNGKAVLFPGAGGSGKSTTTLSCLQSNMQTTGDDYNIIYNNGNNFCIAPVYSNIKVKSGSRFFFPITSSWKKETVSYAEKIIYYPPLDSSIWDKSAPELHGILCPVISDKPGIAAIKPSVLINKLAVSSIMQSPFMAEDYLIKASLLARHVKTANLFLSADIEENANLIEKWLKKQ